MRLVPPRRPEPRLEVEVVGQLSPVVVELLVSSVVVAGSRVQRQVIDQVPVRLVEREVPVVVLGAGLHELVLGAVVDVVAQADEGTYGSVRGQALHRAGHGELAAAIVAVDDADAVVTHRQHGHGHMVIGVRVGTQSLVVPPPRRCQTAAARAELPIPSAHHHPSRHRPP